MRIKPRKSLVCFHTDRLFVLAPGREADVPDDLGEDLVASGQAESLEPETEPTKKPKAPPKAKVTKPPETK